MPQAVDLNSPPPTTTQDYLIQHQRPESDLTSVSATDKFHLAITRFIILYISQGVSTLHATKRSAVIPPCHILIFSSSRLKYELIFSPVSGVLKDLYVSIEVSFESHRQHCNILQRATPSISFIFPAVVLFPLISFIACVLFMGMLLKFIGSLEQHCTVAEYPINSQTSCVFLHVHKLNKYNCKSFFFLPMVKGKLWSACNINLMSDQKCNCVN